MQLYFKINKNGINVYIEVMVGISPFLAMVLIPFILFHYPMQNLEAFILNRLKANNREIRRCNLAAIDN